MKRFLLFAPLLALALVGCASSGTVSEADQRKASEGFSQAAYEAAMKRAGKTKELEAEKARNAQRNDQQVEGQQ